MSEFSIHVCLKYWQHAAMYRACFQLSDIVL